MVDSDSSFEPSSLAASISESEAETDTETDIDTYTDTDTEPETETERETETDMEMGMEQELVADCGPNHREQPPGPSSGPRPPSPGPRPPPLSQDPPLSRDPLLASVRSALLTEGYRHLLPFSLLTPPAPPADGAALRTRASSLEAHFAAVAPHVPQAHFGELLGFYRAQARAAEAERRVGLRRMRETPWLSQAVDDFYDFRQSQLISRVERSLDCLYQQCRQQPGTSDRTRRHSKAQLLPVSTPSSCDQTSSMMAACCRSEFEDGTVMTHVCSE